MHVESTPGLKGYFSSLKKISNWFKRKIPKRGQPLYKGQLASPQCVLYSEVHRVVLRTSRIFLYPTGNKEKIRLARATIHRATIKYKTTTYKTIASLSESFFFGAINLSGSSSIFDPRAQRARNNKL